MRILNILSLNVTGLNSAVKRTRVLEYLHRKSISGALICNTASSGTFLHVFWECPVVIDLWTRVNLGSVLRTSLTQLAGFDCCRFRLILDDLVLRSSSWSCCHSNRSVSLNLLRSSLFHVNRIRLHLFKQN